jgi:putative transposase
MIHHDVGIDGNKGVKGRKRHILGDSLGLLMVAVVTAANVSDAQGLRLLLEKLKRSTFNLQRWYLLYVDGGYRGEALCRWVMDAFGVILQMVLRPQGQRGFQVLPRRWVIERTFGWFYWCRRLSRDYECTTQSAEAWLYLASIRLLLRRLA